MFSPSASGPCQQVIRKVIVHRLQAAEKQGDVLARALASLTDDLTAALLAAAPHVVAATELGGRISDFAPRVVGSRPAGARDLLDKSR